MSPEVVGVLLALAAGLCTAVGGACVFWIETLKRLPLAACMALSAGVMTYVSFVEIFPESRLRIGEGLRERDIDTDQVEPYEDLFVTLCFFGGWIIATLMDVGLEYVVKYCSWESTTQQSANESSTAIEACESRHSSLDIGKIQDHDDGHVKAISEIGNSEVASKITDLSTKDLTSAKEVKNDILQNHNTRDEETNSCCLSKICTRIQACVGAVTNLRNEESIGEIAHAEKYFHRDTHRFFQMGIFTAVALALHNLPEGVATFLGTIAKNDLGLKFALAIGIHNIPEGFAVSIPLYFGTGKKWTSFFYSVATGFAEPIGALLAWAVMQNFSGDLALGIAFGIVCGIMTNIALRELLPAAFKYDPCDQVTTLSFIGGMGIMAISLVLPKFR